ncbi:DUF362 domain-containing protein [Candidatus Cloacimonas acidaminovorans]|uniref:Ferredoxin, 4Fe-4S putative signal peptide n=1 Tax=Cloacimonas acidaminovorans (strain Evry) TaxID=459349 RepID=B0VIC3_CLOAI|nr:4Fe-4S binding protein [Candidatus Cloacimonas acidaminovorans]CAO81111.1 putative ferredoxin, 4Fe-4S; putative signal peptide [Candidatus Cloacimonas acidaminovorans str. Evry]
MKVILQILVLLLLGGILIFLFYNAFLSFAMNKDDCSVTSIPQQESRQFNNHTLNSDRQDKIPTPKENEFSSTIRTQSQNIKTEPSSTQPQAKTSLSELHLEDKPLSTEPSETTNTSHKTIYQVNKDLCIGCKLCIRYCPEGAISIKNGKAVIDTTKCTACGICSDGNNKNFSGCPVGAVFSRKL